MTAPVRPCAVLVPAFRAAGDDQTRRVIALEVAAATAPNLATALWEEHHAEQRVTATKGRGKGSQLVDRHVAALADRNAATKTIRDLLGSFPDGGTRPFPEAPATFDPTPAQTATTIRSAAA